MTENALVTGALPSPHVRGWGVPATLAVLAILLAYLPLNLVLLAAGAGTGALALIRAPWLIWPLLGVALPFAAGVRLGPVAGSDVLLAGAVGLWFADGARRGTLRLTWYAPATLGLLYAGVLLGVSLGAVQLGEATKEVLKWSEFVLVLLVLPQMVAPRHAAWVVGGLLFGAVLQAGLGLVQFILQIGPEWFVIMGRFMRASGTFRQPNPFAGYLGLTLPVAVSLALWGWAALWRTRDSRSHVIRPALVALSATVAASIIGAGLLASWSRGGWLGAAAGVATVIVFRSRRTFMLALLAVTVLLAAVLLGSFGNMPLPEPVAARVQDLPAYFGMTDVLSQPVTDENFSVIERLAHWVAAVRMWEQAPWFGIGPGNYAVIYPNVRLPRWEDALGHAHNVYLNVLAESGLVGLAAYGALGLGTLAWVIRRRHLVGAESWWNALALGVLGVLVHLTVHNLVDNLFVQGMVVLLGLWLALVQLAPRETA